MKYSTFKAIINVILLIIVNIILFFMTSVHEGEYFVTIIFPNIALLIAQIGTGQFKFKLSQNKILANLVAYVGFAILSISSAILLLLDINLSTILVSQLSLSLILFIVYFAVYFIDKNTHKLEKNDKNASVNYRAWIIDLEDVSTKKSKTVQKEIESLIEIIKYSPKAMNSITNDLDNKIKASISLLSDDNLSEKECLEIIAYIKGFIKEKNNMLNLTN